jgi:uncharacterized membrane protein
MKNKTGRLNRPLLSVFGIILILMGISSILKGNPNYGNFFGGVVFSPVAIIVGVLILIIVTFRWESTGESNSKSNRKK